jgi:hypothetical protein
MAIERVGDSIEFAKEIAFELGLHQQGVPSDDMLVTTLDIMNGHLFGTAQNVRVLLKACEAYLVPTHEFEAMLMPDWEFDASRVPDPIIKAKVDSFEWWATGGFSGFGLRVFGVSFVEPKRHHTETAFVPIDAVDLRLSVL